MEHSDKNGKLKGIGYYLPKAIKFYSLKNEKLTKMVFVIILFISFLSSLMPVKTSTMISPQDILINAVTIAIVYLASTVYLQAFIRELKGKEYTARECFHRVMRKALRIVIASLLYGISVVLGALLFVIPGIWIGVVFILYICYIVDLGENTVEAFQASKRMTKGYRWQIFGIWVVFNLALIIPVFFLISIAASTGKSLVFTFVTAFVGAIINLMQQRLVALLYMDLEYGTIKEDKRQE